MKSSELYKYKEKFQMLRIPNLNSESSENPYLATADENKEIVEQHIIAKSAAINIKRT